MEKRSLPSGEKKTPRHFVLENAELQFWQPQKARVKISESGGSRLLVLLGVSKVIKSL